MTLANGTNLGPYRIEACLGHGGMGEVYRARDRRVGRDVAIKMISESFASKDDCEARFAREARLLATVNHPNIGALYEFESDGQHSFLVMELVEGETLAERLKRGPLVASDVIPLFVQIAEGLEAAHKKGIVHRDLKPGNIKIADETVKILDFGLSKEVKECEQGGGEFQSTLGVDLSQSGQVMGTPPYMSPEQVRGHQLDKRSDIWAFGCVLYEALAGRRAFLGDVPAEIMDSIVCKEPDWDSLPQDAPPSMIRLLKRCLCKDPRQRLQDIGDARIELVELAGSGTGVRQSGTLPTQPSWLGKYTRRLVFASVLLAAAILALVLMSRPVRKPVVLLMDSSLKNSVYDEETRRSGGTNADDLTLCLRNLPVTTHKELIYPTWAREREVIEEQPDLILIHRSGFVNQNEIVDWKDVAMSEPDVQDAIKRRYSEGWERLLLFLGTVAVDSSHTRFVVYSRRWTPEGQKRWVSDAERRFPALTGRLHTFSVPLSTDDKGSFRVEETAGQIVQKVVEVLQLQ